MAENLKRALLASNHDRYLAESAPLLLSTARAMAAGQYRYPPGAERWRQALETGAMQLEQEVLAAIARVAVDARARPRANPSSRGGRPSRRDEICAAFDELPEPERSRFLQKGKTVLYHKLRGIILKKTGLPAMLGDHAMSEALKERLEPKPKMSFET